MIAMIAERATLEKVIGTYVHGKPPPPPSLIGNAKPNTEANPKPNLV
jgi:hypothetical protein